ncbi:MAG TPA: RelA/SpoT family protein [Candidatus Paceibacterota bacterium]
MESVKETLGLRRDYTQKETNLIERAFAFAQKAHEGQKRFSGEPYFNHVLETAKILANLNMDATTIAAGLLHDVVEETAIDEKSIENEFGQEAMFLIRGVTKLGKYQYKGLTRHTESLRKFLLAMSQDIRVLIIRLADRLHNMRTLEHVREDKRRRIALETLEIYAALAERLGIGQVKGELEDLAFPYVYPEEYAETLRIHREKSKDAKERLEKMYRSLHKAFLEGGIRPVNVDYRVKHLYSTYKKLVKYDMDPEKIHDITALRIIVGSVEECYRALGIIHGKWNPLPGRIKDYIATPKQNGYQSLHTTIFTGDGGIVEAQIRTAEMHRDAEFGIAAHLGYKEGLQREKGHTLHKKLAWIEQLAESQKNLEESGEFLEHLKMNLFADRVFVFTPHGDVIDLPEGSYPIDFAYAIHSDIGDHFAGAKINNKLSSLDTKLKTGDIVEIVTKKKGVPSSKWLDHAKTPFARKHIKAATQKK